MARRSRNVFLAVLFVVAVASAAMVSAYEAAPSIAEQAQATEEAATEQAKATKETATEETAPTIKEKIEAMREIGKKEAELLGETVQSWREWAKNRAGEFTGKGKKKIEGTTESAKAYAGKGGESIHSSKVQGQESASGMYNKWSRWAKETVGKYKPKKSPAATASEYFSKQTSGAQENEDL